METESPIEAGNGVPQKPMIMNQYAPLNEPLDVLMGGSGALLQIVHTLVGSLSRLDGAVETLFERLDSLEGNVSTLTFNIQGFEPEPVMHKVPSFYSRASGAVATSAMFSGHKVSSRGGASDHSMGDGAVPESSRSNAEVMSVHGGSDKGSRQSTPQTKSSSPGKGASHPASPDGAAPSSHPASPDGAAPSSLEVSSLEEESTDRVGTYGASDKPGRPRTAERNRPRSAGSRPKTPEELMHETQVAMGGIKAEDTHPSDSKYGPWKWKEYPVGPERDEAAAARLQQMYRGHMTRGMRATLARIKALDMSHRKIPKSLSVSNRIERCEQLCEEFGRTNIQLEHKIDKVIEDSKAAIAEAEKRANKALAECASMRKENKALQDRVDESLLEAAQRLDAMNTKVEGFQDEVSAGFAEQGALVAALRKDVDYSTSPEGQAALKDGLIEKEMGSVLDLVNQVAEAIAGATPLPRQDSELTTQLKECGVRAGSAMDKAKALEEEERADAAAKGQPMAQDSLAWLAALNEPDFMNELAELLWASHLTLKEDSNQQDNNDSHVLANVPSAVPSLTDLLADCSNAICAVLDNFLNKGRQQVSIREMSNSLLTIKSAVVADVAEAVQSKMDAKTDLTEFLGLQKRADAAIKDLAKMKPDVELWGQQKEMLVGLDIDQFNELKGTVDETNVSVYALNGKLDQKVSAADLEMTLGGLQAQFAQLEEKAANGEDAFAKMLEPKADRAELAKAIRALATKGDKEADPVLAFYTDKPKFHCLSCNRPLPKIPNSTDSERPPSRGAPEVSGSGAIPQAHQSVLLPGYDTPLAKVRPPPRQRPLPPNEQHKYSLDLAEPPPPGMAPGPASKEPPIAGSPLPIEQGAPVSRYQRNIPNKPSRLQQPMNGGGLRPPST